MQRGNILELEIVSEGMNGEGVAKQDGFVIFIPQTLLGEIVKCEITLVKKSFANAKVIKLIKKSPFRRMPLCPIFYQCGGCEMQHIDYQRQLIIKRQNIINCLTKECKRDFPVEQVDFGKNSFGYRNKIQVPFSRNIKDEVVCGYYKPNSHTIVPFGKLTIQDNANYCVNEVDIKNLGNCPLHNNKIQSIVDCFKKFVENSRLSCYDSATAKGIVRHLVIRQIGDCFSIVIVANADKIYDTNILIDKLNNLGIEFSLYLCINKKDTNVIMTNDVRLLHGKSTISGEVLGVKINYSPVSFLQINDEIRDKIYSKVNEIIAQTPNCVVVDAYSGIGILSNVMAKTAKHVYAIEIVKQAVEDAKNLAKLNNNQEKITNLCGDAVDLLPQVVSKLTKSGDSVTVVVDPPRKGCDRVVIDSICSANPNQIIYISCNPSTLARDLNLLLDSYKVKSILPYDMFPMTGHVETLVCLERK